MPDGGCCGRDHLFILFRVGQDPMLSREQFQLLKDSMGRLGSEVISALRSMGGGFSDLAPTNDFPFVETSDESESSSL